MGSLLSVDYLWLSWLYKWKPTAVKSYRDATHSHSCEAEHGGHDNASIAASVQTSLQHKHTHGLGKATQDLGEGHHCFCNQAQVFHLCATSKKTACGEQGLEKGTSDRQTKQDAQNLEIAIRSRGLLWDSCRFRFDVA
ncbi:hypothetical protein ABG768_005176 [Culter alburnus]|uniref:Uncharacterized protein n=1 Tax=Culter alburnus TaxID=194366 RepID=A0AAW1ZRP3_CULAL